MLSHAPSCSSCLLPCPDWSLRGAENTGPNPKPATPVVPSAVAPARQFVVFAQSHEATERVVNWSRGLAVVAWPHFCGRLGSSRILRCGPQRAGMGMWACASLVGVRVEKQGREMGWGVGPHILFGLRKR